MTDERRGRRRDGREGRKERCLRQPLARRQGGSQLVTVTTIPLLLSSLFPLTAIPRIARTYNRRLTSSNDFAEAAESSSLLRREAEVEVDARW